MKFPKLTYRVATSFGNAMPINVNPPTVAAVVPKASKILRKIEVIMKCHLSGIKSRNLLTYWLSLSFNYNFGNTITQSLYFYVSSWVLSISIVPDCLHTVDSNLMAEYMWIYHHLLWGWTKGNQNQNPNFDLLEFESWCPGKKCLKAFKKWSPCCSLMNQFIIMGRIQLKAFSVSKKIPMQRDGSILIVFF